jgi:hypothetical protein
MPKQVHFDAAVFVQVALKSQWQDSLLGRETISPDGTVLMPPRFGEKMGYCPERPFLGPSLAEIGWRFCYSLAKARQPLARRQGNRYGMLTMRKLIMQGILATALAAVGTAYGAPAMRVLRFGLISDVHVTDKHDQAVTISRKRNVWQAESFPSFCLPALGFGHMQMDARVPAAIQSAGHDGASGKPECRLISRFFWSVTSPGTPRIPSTSWSSS